MLFIPLPKLLKKHKETLLNIYSKCDRYLLYENKNVARSVNVFIDSIEHQDWIYNTLILPLNISRYQIKNNHEESKCCGINFNVFRPGDWSYPHCDLNPTKIHFLLQGDPIHFLVFIDENVYWNYSSPAILDVSKSHAVNQLEKLTSMRIMLQIFLIEKIEYYAKILSD